MSFVTRSKLAKAMVGLALAASLLFVAGLLFVIQHRQSSPATSESAAAEFSRLRAKFSGQSLLDLQEQQESTASLSVETHGPLASFHTVIFDTRNGSRIIRIHVPYWFGRLFARHAGEFHWLGELTFLGDTEFDPEAIRLPLEQIERHGPGLLVKREHPDGAWFISWVE